MTAPTAHRARLRYTEPMLRRAVRTFMWRRVLGRPGFWLAAAVPVAALAWLAREDGATFLTGVLAAAVGLLFLVVAAVWRAQSRHALGRLRAMRPPEADLVLDEAGLTVTSSLGSAVLPWSSFTETWERPGFLMLFLAPNSFMTVPTADLAPEMLRFLRSQLPGGA